MKLTDSLKRVNIPLSEKLHMQSKLISILKHKKLNEYLLEAIEERVSKDKDLIKQLGEQ